MSEGFHLPKTYVARMVEDRIKGDLGKFKSNFNGEYAKSGRSLDE